MNRSCIPRNEIEELGEGIIKKYLDLLGFEEVPGSIDIEDLARSLGLRIEVAQIWERDMDKTGCLANVNMSLRVCENGKVILRRFPTGTIVVDARSAANRGHYRFTIAHEVAHYILDKHQAIGQFQREFDPERNYTLAELHERLNFNETNADALAARLLMPSFVIQKALKDYNRGKKIPVYGYNVFSPDDRKKIKAMAQQIGVSYTALLIQLQSFRLLERHPLEDYIGELYWPEGLR